MSVRLKNLMVVYLSLWGVWVLVGGSMCLYLGSYFILDKEESTLVDWGAIVALLVLLVLCAPGLILLGLVRIVGKDEPDFSDADRHA